MNRTASRLTDRVDHRAGGTATPAGVGDGTRPSPLALLPAGGHARPSWDRWYAVVLIALDVMSMGLAVVAGRAPGLEMFLSVDGTPIERTLAAVTLLVGAAWVIALSLNGAYKKQWLGTGSEEYRRVFDTAWRSIALVALAAFLLDIRLGRMFVVVTVLFATATSVVFRYLLRRHLHCRRARGQFMKRVLLVGSRSSCHELAGRLVNAPHAGLRPVAACCVESTHDLAIAGAVIPVLGEPARALNAALTMQADAIAIADTGTFDDFSLRRLAEHLGGTGIELLVNPAAEAVRGPRISAHPISEVPLVQVEEPQVKGLQRAVKLAVDRLGALVALVLLFPLLVTICIVIRVTSRGPALFRQNRVGLGGRHFKVWKFRTMIPDAESVLSSIVHLNEQDGVLFKMRHDPRVTPVGRMLRRWSLDELPQLWNVLRGDMSIVGPRPPIVSEVARYDDRVRQRLLVRPGITGLWQVSGRAELVWEEAVRLDLYYVENWSLSMDAVILGRTCIAVLRRRGAY